MEVENTTTTTTSATTTTTTTTTNDNNNNKTSAIIDHVRLLTTDSPYGNETGSLPNGEFEPGQEVVNAVNEAKILVIGAGGLGCEILKDLSMSGFKNIHVIDMDTIDVSNLNRQFLFRQKDVGDYKSKVAANFIMNRVPSCKVIAHTCRIQEKDEEWYKAFQCIVAGLDNIDARRWMNSLLCSFVKYDEDGDIDPDESTIIPLIDGGTEGFKGQARVILPRITSCFECSMDTFTPTTAFQICTVAENPRKPEHCIAYVMFAINGQVSGKSAVPIKEGWAKLFGSETKLDKDSPEHMRYICENAIERAREYNITPLPDYMLTMGVVKSIIPAIASTNALIAACCCNEAFKMVSFASQTMNCWHQYMGATGVNSLLIQYKKRDGCPVCSGKPVYIHLDPTTSTLGDLRLLLKEAPHSFGDCSFRTAGATLYMNKPISLRKATEKNLTQKLCDLGIGINTEVYVTSEKLQVPLVVKISQ